MDPKRALGKIKRKNDCGVVGVYKVTWECKLSKNNLLCENAEKGWDLEDLLGSSSIYWHLLCARCCARAWRYRDESYWALSIWGSLSSPREASQAYAGWGLPPCGVTGKAWCVIW